MGHGGHGMMNMPMKMRVDRETMGGRVMGTWLWTDYELRSGADMQTNKHRKIRIIVGKRMLNSKTMGYLVS